VDIMPTLVHCLDLDVDSSEFVGQSLWPVVQEGSTAGLRGFVVADAAPDRVEAIVAIRTDRWKLIIDSGKGSTELYDLDNDPGERVNVIQQHPLLAETLSAQLQSELRRGPGVVQAQAHRPGWSAAEEEEVLARLRALGYVDWVEDHAGH